MQLLVSTMVCHHHPFNKGTSLSHSLCMPNLNPAHVAVGSTLPTTRMSMPTSQPLLALALAGLIKLLCISPPPILTLATPMPATVCLNSRLLQHRPSLPQVLGRAGHTDVAATDKVDLWQFTQAWSLLGVDVSSSHAAGMFNKYGQDIRGLLPVTVGAHEAG